MCIADLAPCQPRWSTREWGAEDRLFEEGKRGMKYGGRGASTMDCRRSYGGKTHYVERAEEIVEANWKGRTSNGLLEKTMICFYY